MSKDLVIIAIGIAGMVITGILWPMRHAARLARLQGSGGRPGTAPPPAPGVGLAVRIGLAPFELAVATALSVAVFLAVLGPAWERQYDVDRAVITSYLAIPPIVLALLMRRRRLDLGRFVLGTLVVATFKFVITAAMVITVFAVWGPTRLASSTSAGAGVKSAIPIEREAAPETLRTIRGRVIDEHGAAVEGAVVYVRAGLERYAFSPEERPRVSLDNDGRGFSPRLLVVRSGQPWRLTSSDGRLHTLRAIDRGGAQRFNQSAVPGKVTERRVPLVSGLFDTDCAVHEDREPSGRILVLRHPFHVVTAADGTFALEVPDAPLELAAVHEDQTAMIIEHDSSSSDELRR